MLVSVRLLKTAHHDCTVWRSKALTTFAGATDHKEEGEKKMTRDPMIAFKAMFPFHLKICQREKDRERI